MNQYQLSNSFNYLNRKIHEYFINGLCLIKLMSFDEMPQCKKRHFRKKITRI